jgi:hypothetical protein
MQEVTHFHLYKSLPMNSGLNPKFKIDPTVVGTNFA